MQTCRLPGAICDRLDGKVRCFLWAGTNTERELHLVAWATVTKPVEEGGLGIRSMRRELNSMSMAKLAWRMLQDLESLWARVLRHKYCKGRVGVDMFETCRNPSNLWKGISESKFILQQSLVHSIRDGQPP